MPRLPMKEIKGGQLGPPEFARMQTLPCIHVGCTAYARYRIGVLDTCGRHTAWAINAQVDEGDSSENLFMGRYMHF